MGVLSRFKDIMSSQIGDVLNKKENPEKVIQEYLRELNLDLGKVTSETASLMEDEKRTKRALNECQTNIDKMERYAMKALEAGNEADARTYLEKKADFAAKLSDLETTHQQISLNAKQMKQMHDKLVADIGELASRAKALKIKTTAAKTQDAVFGQMEEKASQALFEAEALAELRADPLDELEDLSPIDHDSRDIDADLQALKDKMKKS